MKIAALYAGSRANRVAHDRPDRGSGHDAEQDSVAPDMIIEDL